MAAGEGRKYSFWFHYNRPASQQAGRSMMTVHFRGVCHIVCGVDVRVSCRSRSRRTQPVCVMAGHCRQLTFLGDGTVVIE